MATNLDKLRREMPLVFALRDDLVRIISDETSNYQIEVDRLRFAHVADFEQEQRRAYEIYSAKIAPVQAEIEHINKKIVDILSLMPQEPISVTQLPPNFSVRPSRAPG